MSFFGRGEAPNILHGGKILAPHFKDEIAGLKKWPLLAGFLTFFGAFFYYDSYLWAHNVYVAEKLSPGVFSWPRGGSKHCTIPF